jgi:hypothetical protein
MALWETARNLFVSFVTGSQRSQDALTTQPLYPCRNPQSTPQTPQCSPNLEFCERRAVSQKTVLAFPYRDLTEY